MTKHELMNVIYQATFMLDELTLYLDTHPDCSHAMEAYMKYKKIRDEAYANYTNAFGPLSRYNVNLKNGWSWINDPWPWEGECGC